MIYARMGVAAVFGALAGVTALGAALGLVGVWGLAAVAVAFVLGLIAAPDTVD